jgi:hypothetical protein
MELILAFILGACVMLIAIAWHMRNLFGGTMPALAAILRGGGPGEEG